MRCLRMSRAWSALAFGLGRSQRFPMTLRKALLLALVSALTFLPILQGAHALTHVDDAGITATVHADGHEEIGESDADARLDADRVCLDCLALAGLAIIFMALAGLSSNRRRCQALPFLNRGPVPLDFSLPYLVRGPPRL